MLFNIISLIFLPSLHMIAFSHAQSEGSFFSKMPFHKLDGNIIQAIAVPNILQCCWKCDRLPECFSLNVADVPHKNGLYECQMLRTETNKYSTLLKPSQHYHHYTRFTDPCVNSRCLNGATCESLGMNDFRCNCPQGFKGDLCNVPVKLYKWLKINSSPVCFGAKNSEYGIFKIPCNGAVTTVKLIHQSGYVVCDIHQHSGQSNWGCAPYSLFQDRMMTIITDNKDQKILPQDELVTIDFSYKISGFTSKSPELIFKNFTMPMDVNAGQEYRIWYGQDLKNFRETNNGGTSCTDVYMYGLFE